PYSTLFRSVVTVPRVAPEDWQVTQQITGWQVAQQATISAVRSLAAKSRSQRLQSVDVLRDLQHLQDLRRVTVGHAFQRRLPEQSPGVDVVPGKRHVVIQVHQRLW